MIKKLATALVAVMMLVPQAVMAYEVGESPVITNHYATPNPYDPDNGSTDIRYHLNTDAVVVVEILEGSTVIRNLGRASKTAGDNSSSWDGKENGAFVDEGTYSYRITASNTWGSSIATGSITVDFQTSQGTAPSISGDYASPSPFDPSDESTTINYTLNTAATVTVSILDGSNTVRTLGTASQSSGANHMTWDGKISGVNASEGTYTYSIYATNTYGNDTETGTVTVDYAGQSGTAPNITNDYASPTSFDPNDETTTIYYTLNTTADVTVTVLDGSSTIETIQSSVSRTAGTYSVNWDGRNSGNSPYSEGTYTYRVYATNSSGSDTETGNVTIDYDGGSSCTTPSITSHYVTPSEFDPDEDDARITFNLNTSADVTVTIRGNSGVIRTLVDDDDMSSGTHNVYWNGEDDDDDQVSDGTYTYRIYALNNCGSDTEQSTVRVDSDGNDDDDDDNDDYDFVEDNYGDLISDVRVEDALFDPEDDERAKLLFDVEEDNVYITVRIIDTDEDVVRTLVTSNDYDESNDNSVYWNGKDQDGDIVDDDLYLFKITATKSGESSEVAYRWLEVDTDGKIIGFPDDDNDDDDYCAGFTDVSEDNPYCKAIELMKIKGIFTGYSDGTFRLYNPINRAETTKVTLLAIGYSIMKDDGTNLGFWDVVKKAWYMSYLRTAKNRGIINGYPDSSFRPNSTPNKVELLKIFLEGTGINIPYCNAAPYNDTPATAETRWYLNYVCFAANNGLISGDYSGNFYPASAMTRGDVAMLFYNFYVRGLYNDSPNYTYTTNTYYGYPYYY
jgi:flagellar hook assembly protein FlgD